MSGYYRDPVATAAVFDGGWLRTGDLGFVRDGALFVTGRMKELMILNGRNYYPHDIEDVVQRLPGCHRKMAVAFASADERGEHMVVVAETRCDEAGARGLALASQRAVSAAFSIPRIEVVLVRPGTVPRTTSGKRQRLLVRSQLRSPAFREAVIWSSGGA
jgi:fatty-acyl-CoA synthase